MGTEKQAHTEPVLDRAGQRVPPEVSLAVHSCHKGPERR